VLRGAAAWATISRKIFIIVFTQYLYKRYKKLIKYKLKVCRDVKKSVGLNFFFKKRMTIEHIHIFILTDTDSTLDTRPTLLSLISISIFWKNI